MSLERIHATVELLLSDNTSLMVQKRMEERVAMSETAVYMPEKFVSSGEPSVNVLF